ncbi:MAG: Ig-like domain-containing protein [Clostridiales bacterium]|nr:Ig-like domain-containing protein [Clostridiales bacterium]
MTKRVLSVLLALVLMLGCIPASVSLANEPERLQGDGHLELDTDPTGGYEGDYVVIYNPSTIASTSTEYSTGDMSGLIETEVDPNAKSPSGENVLYRIDVDAEIAEQNALRPSVRPKEGERVSYNVGDTHTFTISNYSPGPSSLSFKCVAKGEHCYVWTPAQNNTNYYPLDVIDATYPGIVAEEFDSIYDLMNSSFGDHSNGTQGDGRVHLMYYNIADSWQPGSTSGYVAGYFSSYDFNTNAVPMIHIDTYPCVYYVNQSTNEPVYDLENSYSVFCHEYQHLINYSITNGMDTWLNESMSAAAEEICYPGSSVIPRIQSWENYYYSRNDDWLNPPHEFNYTSGYELHNGYSMYKWNSSLSNVLPLYSQVSFFSQYLFTHYGNTIFKSITQQYSNTGSAVSAIANATGADTSELVKNFRIALVANDPVSYDGLYGFTPQNGYDPEQYHSVQNPYDLLGPVVFTGSQCSIAAGGAIVIKPIDGLYFPASGADSHLEYIGIKRKPDPDPVNLWGVALSPSEGSVYVGNTLSLRVIRYPSGANNYDAVWSSSDESIATVTGSRYSALIRGISPGTVTITILATDLTTFRSFEKSIEIEVKPMPTLDEALNVLNGSLEFTSTGDYPWAVDTNYEGRICGYSSNAKVSNSESTVQLTIDMQAGETLSFDWAVSSESNYDKLTFYANGAEVANISGSTGFATKTYTAGTTGSYTFKWTYKKDYSVDNGLDMAFLDNVAYSGDPGKYMLGDVNLNNEVNSADALLVVRYTMNLCELEELPLFLADYNQDGDVTSADALCIIRKSMGLE